MELPLSLKICRFQFCKRLIVITLKRWIYVTTSCILNLESLMIKVFVIISLTSFFHCDKKPYHLKYPVEVTLSIDSLGVFGPYSPEFGPNLILNIKNIGLENIVIKEVRPKHAKDSFIPTFNRVGYFKGDIDKPVDGSYFAGIREYWSLTHIEDTLWKNQEHTYLFEPTHGRIFRDSVSFIIIELQIKAPYFDSLNVKEPFVYDRLYFKKHKEITPGSLTEVEMRHPFFVFSTKDSLNLVDLTNAFIGKEIIKRKHNGLVN